MQIVRRRGDWLTSEIDGEAVMMNVETGRYVGLSQVGTQIWQMIDEPKPVGAMLQALQKRYDVTPEQCDADVKAFLETMIEYGAIEIS